MSNRDFGTKMILLGAAGAAVLGVASLPHHEAIVVTPQQASLGVKAFEGEQVVIEGKVTVGDNFVYMKNAHGDTRAYVPWTVSDASGAVTVYSTTHTDNPVPGSLTNQFHSGQSPIEWKGAVASARGGNWYIEGYPEGAAFKPDVSKL